MVSVISTVTTLLVVFTSLTLAADNHDTRYLVFLKIPEPCAGSIVAPNWVLTSAHCCHNSSDPKSYFMLAGSPLHYQQRQGEELHIHPNATADNPQSKSYNLALFKVTPSWTIGQYVRVIHMFFGPFPRYPVLNNGCFAAGWNRNANHDDVDKNTPVPSTYRLTVVASKQCIKKLDRPVYENNVCARDQFGSWDSSVTDFGGYPCAGDLGGPLVCDIFTEGGQLKPMLAGVMSSYEEAPNGTELCRLVFYAQTAHLASWMSEHVAHIEREGLDEPLRSRILGVQDVDNAASTSSRRSVAVATDEHPLSVVFSYSGVTIAVVQGASSRRLVAFLMATLCYMRIATLVVVILHFLDHDRAWGRFGYIAAI